MFSDYDIYYIKQDGSSVFYGASFQNIMDVMIPFDLSSAGDLKPEAQAICVYPQWYYYNNNLNHVYYSDSNCISL